MDTSSIATAAAKTVCIYQICLLTIHLNIVQVPAASSGPGSSAAASSLVTDQDAELCSLIDQLIGT